MFFAHLFSGSGDEGVKASSKLFLSPVFCQRNRLMVQKLYTTPAYKNVVCVRVFW